MALTILELLSGDTAYISKHNTNYAAIKAAIEALQSAVTGSGSGVDLGSVPVAYESLFGGANCIIGADSFVPTDSGTDYILSVAAGYAYIESSDLVVTQSIANTLNFAGQSTGTYYIHLDTDGVPYFDATPTGAFYSVYYDQSTHHFSSVALVSNLFEQATDQDGTRTNLWEVSYPTIDDRIDGTERSSFYVLQKTIEADDVTLTDQEAFEQNMIYLLDGPQTSNVALNVPAQQRIYTVISDCAEAYTVTVTPDGGVGYALAGNRYAVLYCDGSIITPIFLLDRSIGAAPPTNFTDLLDAPASYSGHGAELVAVNATETGTEFVAVDDAPVSGATTVPVSSNWAYDHVAAADPHPGYLTETEADLLYAPLGGGGTQPFYISGFCLDRPVESTPIIDFVAACAVAFEVDLAGSYCESDTAAAAQTDFDVQKNGSSVGTMRFAASATTATFIAASPISLAAGDRLKLITPASQDATLAGLSWTIAGTR